LVPLEIYFKDGRCKVEVGVGRGKRAVDKRQDLKKKDAEREIRRAERGRD
jgi:SsrA-binding protein